MKAENSLRIFSRGFSELKIQNPKSKIQNPPISFMHPVSKIQNPKSKIQNSPASFTLVELMVVIAVIAILLGLIIPTYSGIREQARKTKARATVKHLETAFREYYNYYRTWPVSGDVVYKLDGSLYEIMQGDNPQNRAFIEFEASRGAPTTNEIAYDPWKYDLDGNEEWRAYRVQFDHDFNNAINHGGETIYRSVIVWSVGPDRVCYTEDNSTKDDIRSWE